MTKLAQGQEQCICMGGMLILEQRSRYSCLFTERRSKSCVQRLLWSGSLQSRNLNPGLLNGAKEPRLPVRMLKKSAGNVSEHLELHLNRSPPGVVLITTLT